MQLTYYPRVYNIVANTLTRKYKELKMQKVKSNAACIMTLINPVIINNAVKTTTLEINY